MIGIPLQVFTQKCGSPRETHQFSFEKLVNFPFYILIRNVRDENSITKHAEHGMGWEGKQSVFCGGWGKHSYTRASLVQGARTMDGYTLLIKTRIIFLEKI